MQHVGKSRRSIITVFKEHLDHTKYWRTEKSSIAQYNLEQINSVDVNSIKRIRHVNNIVYFNDYKILEISKQLNLMNNDNGPIPNSLLYNFLA